MVAVANNTTLTEQAGSFDTKRLRRRKLVDHFSSNQIYILYYEYYNNTKVIQYHTKVYNIIRSGARE